MWRQQQQQTVNDQRSNVAFGTSGSQQVFQQQPQQQPNQGHAIVQNPGYDVNTIRSSSTMTSSYQRSGLIPPASYQQTANFHTYMGNNGASQPMIQPSLTTAVNQQLADAIRYDGVRDGSRSDMQNGSYAMSWQQPVSQNTSGQSATSFGLVQNGEHFAAGRQHQTSSLPRQTSMTSSQGAQRTSDTDWSVEQAILTSNTGQRHMQQQQQQQHQQISGVNATVSCNGLMSPSFQQQQQQQQRQQLFVNQASGGASTANRSATLPAGVRQPTIEPGDYTIKRVQSVEQYQQATTTTNQWPVLRRDDESGLGNTMTSSWTSPSMRTGGDGYRISSTSNDTEMSSSNVSADQSSSGSITMFGGQCVKHLFLIVTKKNCSQLWFCLALL